MDVSRPMPPVFAILERHITGDEALLRLAQAKFEQAGLGAEIYPASVEEALATWQFVPHTYERNTVHLPRHLDLLSPPHRGEILAFARALRGRARVLVLHDRSDWWERRYELLAALDEIERSLAPDEPGLFLEYAAGVELDSFASLIEVVAPLTRISACIDTGHVAVFAAHRSLKLRHPDIEPFEVGPDHPRLGELLPELEPVAEEVRQAVAAFAGRLARLGKPLHFHLHDAHLLSRFSQYGVRDHLSFRQQIPVPTSMSPSGKLRTMLGEEGLVRILTAASETSLTLTLEIHPLKERLRKPLGEHAAFFRHWTDLSHAEMMHHWVSTLVEEYEWLRRLWATRIAHE